MEAATVVERDFNQLTLLFNMVINDMKVGICLIFSFEICIVSNGRGAKLIWGFQMELAKLSLDLNFRV